MTVPPLTRLYPLKVGTSSAYRIPDEVPVGEYTRRRTDISINEERDRAVRTAYARVTAQVLALDLPELTWSHTEIIQFINPDGWWQHWKLDHIDTWWARWFTRRWPARTRTDIRRITYHVDVTRAALFPEAPDVPTEVMEIVGPPRLHVDRPKVTVTDEVVQ